MVTPMANRINRLAASTTSSRSHCSMWTVSLRWAFDSRAGGASSIACRGTVTGGAAIPSGTADGSGTVVATGGDFRGVLGVVLALGFGVVIRKLLCPIEWKTGQQAGRKSIRGGTEFPLPGRKRTLKIRVFSRSE